MAEFHNFATGRSTVVIPDHRNSVAATIDMDTHSVYRLARYTPEGLLTVLEDDGTVICAEGADLTVNCKGPDMPFAFNGMWRSEVSGLSYMRNRWYSPHLAQFMSHDPLEYIDSYNLYAFASLDPVNFWDPWGLESWTVTHNRYDGTLTDGYYRTEAPRLKLPAPGMLRVYFVTRKIEGMLFFNHPYLLIYSSDAKRFRAEGGQHPDGKRLAFDVVATPSSDSPFLEDPNFLALWKNGTIEGVAEAEIEDSGKFANMERLRKRTSPMESKYSLTPSDPDEGNCHTVCKATMWGGPEIVDT